MKVRVKVRVRGVRMRVPRGRYSLHSLKVSRVGWG